MTHFILGAVAGAVGMFAFLFFSGWQQASSYNDLWLNRFRRWLEGGCK